MLASARIASRCYMWPPSMLGWGRCPWPPRGPTEGSHWWQGRDAGTQMKQQHVVLLGQSWKPSLPTLHMEPPVLKQRNSKITFEILLLLMWVNVREHMKCKNKNKTQKPTFHNRESLLISGVVFLPLVIRTLTSLHNLDCIWCKDFSFVSYIRLHHYYYSMPLNVLTLYFYWLKRRSFHKCDITNEFCFVGLCIRLLEANT